jgi:hemin uptake protein HemP
MIKGSKDAEEGTMQGRSGDAKVVAKVGDVEAALEAVRLVGAQALLGPRGILRIEHRGEVYTLRITRNDRLILTK